MGRRIWTLVRRRRQRRGLIDGRAHVGQTLRRDRDRLVVAALGDLRLRQRQLGRGDITRHNRVIARAIRAAQKRGRVDTIVLAQLSMSVFVLEHPDAEAEFGAPVLTSGEYGFRRIRELLLAARAPGD